MPPCRGDVFQDRPPLALESSSTLSAHLEHCTSQATHTDSHYVGRGASVVRPRGDPDLRYHDAHGEVEYHIYCTTTQITYTRYKDTQTCARNIFTKLVSSHTVLLYLPIISERITRRFWQFRTGMPHTPLSTTGGAQSDTQHESICGGNN